ncbi:hypothetical protein RIF29_05892 [Crotalaria pallida]|uniref:Uncharacterized protein n=1 Tax=Crotalaria pallida TaxID=3830 RepID=A0AAN9PAK0_CROPI
MIKSTFDQASEVDPLLSISKSVKHDSDVAITSPTSPGIEMIEGAQRTKRVRKFNHSKPRNTNKGKKLKVMKESGNEMTEKAQKMKSSEKEIARNIWEFLMDDNSANIDPEIRSIEKQLENRLERGNEKFEHTWQNKFIEGYRDAILVKPVNMKATTTKRSCMLAPIDNKSEEERSEEFWKECHDNLMLKKAS